MGQAAKLILHLTANGCIHRLLGFKRLYCVYCAGLIQIPMAASSGY